MLNRQKNVTHHLSHKWQITATYIMMNKIDKHTIVRVSSTLLFLKCKNKQYSELFY